MVRRSLNKKTKTIIISIVSVLLIGCCSAAAISIFGNDSKTIFPTFSAGELDMSGEYVKSESALFTKELIPCKGLTISADLFGDGEYQIFWYNHDKLCIGFENRTYKPFDSKVPDIAKYCRIVLYPDLTEEKESLDKGEEFKFNYFNILKFASKISVSVYKKQTARPVDLYKVALKTATFDSYDMGRITSDVSFVKNSTIPETAERFYVAEKSVSGYEDEDENGYAVIKLKCENIKQYEFIFDDSTEDQKFELFFFKSDESMAADSYVLGPIDEPSYVIDVPTGCDYLCINLVPKDPVKGGAIPEFIINEYSYISFVR